MRASGLVGTSTPAHTPSAQTAGRPTPTFSDEAGGHPKDLTIPWEKPASEGGVGEGTAMASHHHHVEVMNTNHYHPWHYCHPPPSCPHPAPYAFRAFNGSCLGPVDPSSLSPAPVSSSAPTFTWKHDGEKKDCSMMRDRKAGRVTKNKTRRRPAKQYHRHPHFSSGCRPLQQSQADGQRDSSSSDEDSGICQGRITRSELMKQC